MTQRLVLDDVRTLTFPDRIPATTVRTVSDAIDALAAQPWDELYLDFDLDGAPGAGLNDKSEPLAWWIRRQPTPPVVGAVFLHTANTKGREALRVLLGGIYPVRDIWEVPQTRRPLLVVGDSVRLDDGTPGGSPAVWAELVREFILDEYRREAEAGALRRAVREASSVA